MKESNFDSPPNEAQLEQQAEKARAAAVITPESDKALIDQCLREKKTIQQNRQAFERQWLVNIAFLYGKHYFTIEKKPNAGLEERVSWELKNLIKSKKTKKVMNYILPLYRSLLARLLMMKQRVTVDPETNDDRDLSAARVGQEVLEEFWQNVNRTNPLLFQDFAGMPQVLMKLFGYMLATGKGHLIPTFNPNAKAKVVFPHLNKEIITAPVGAIEVEVDHPFNVFSDPMRRYKIRKRILPVDYIEEMYNVAVQAEDVGLSDVEKQLLTLLEGGQDDRFLDSAEVYDRWEIPSKKYPEGRLFICTKDRMLLNSEEGIPREYGSRIPIFDFNFIDIMCAQPQGVVEQLIPSQEDLNHSVSRLHEYKKWMAGKILVPDGTKLSANYNDNVGQVIKYDATQGKPTFDNPPNPPSFILEDILRIKKDMDDIAASHDASVGRLPQGVKSGIAIENLSDLDQSQLSPQLIHIECQLSFFSDMVLNIAEAKYKEPRLIGITGKNLSQDVRVFKGDDLSGNRRIRVSLGSGLPVGRDARQAKINEWLKDGIITKEEAREMLEFGNLDGVMHSIDDSAEKAEIQEMLQGTVVVPMSWENHARRIKILTDFMMGDDFVKLRKQAEAGDQNALRIAKIFVDHRNAHQNFLSAEMQAMNPQPAGPNPPPPAKPAVD